MIYMGPNMYTKKNEECSSIFTKVRFGPDSPGPIMRTRNYLLRYLYQEYLVLIHQDPMMYTQKKLFISMCSSICTENVICF